MFRGGPDVEIVPNAALLRLLSRSRKLVRLNALKISAWNRNLNLSVNPKLRRSEKSHVCAPGPKSVPTPQVPRRVSGAIANASRLAQLFGPRSPSSNSASLLRQSARRLPNTEFAVPVTVRYGPDCNRVTPLTS